MNFSAECLKRARLSRRVGSNTYVFVYSLKRFIFDVMHDVITFFFLFYNCQMKTR